MISPFFLIVFYLEPGILALVKEQSKKKEEKNIGQNQLAFSISQLKPLLALHLIPIKQLVLLRLYGEYSSWSGLRT